MSELLSSDSTGPRSQSIDWISPYFAGLLLVTAATIAWSTAGLFTRIIALDSWTLLFWRGFFGGMAIAAVVVTVSRRRLRSEINKFGFYGWLYALISAVGMVFYITALKRPPWLMYRYCMRSCLWPPLQSHGS